MHCQRASLVSYVEFFRDKLSHVQNENSVMRRKTLWISCQINVTKEVAMVENTQFLFLEEL